MFGEVLIPHPVSHNAQEQCLLRELDRILRIKSAAQTAASQGTLGMNSMRTFDRALHAPASPNSQAVLRTNCYVDCPLTQADTVGERGTQLRRFWRARSAAVAPLAASHKPLLQSKKRQALFCSGHFTF
jgi:hypothetical protein